MKAVVFHSVGDIRLDDVAEPTLLAPTDAIIRVTASAICGTDLHFVRGTVGQFAIARLLGAARGFAIDHHPDRLQMARRQGAETIDFDQEDPVATLKRLTAGIGVDRTIDAVGVDDAIAAFEAFDRREHGWIKVQLRPQPEL